MMIHNLRFKTLIGPAPMARDRRERLTVALIWSCISAALIIALLAVIVVSKF